MKAIIIQVIILCMATGCSSQSAKKFNEVENQVDGEYKKAEPQTQAVDDDEETLNRVQTTEIIKEIVIEEEEETYDEPLLQTVKLTFTNRPAPKSINWKMVGKGLQYAEIDLPMKCNVGDSKLSVLKINPDSATINLASSKFDGTVGFRVDEWADSLGYKAVINAGMFSLGDYMTCTGYMLVDGKANNPNLNKSYNLIAAFKPKTAAVPNFKIIDLRCENWDDWKDQYHSYAQGIRVADCNGINKWSKQEKFWSMVLLGEDKNGNALFLFSRTPYRVHDLSKMILALPLNVENIMYLEGGPEASFRLKTKTLEVSKVGSYETDFNELDDNQVFWSIPNVIYVK